MKKMQFKLRKKVHKTWHGIKCSMKLSTYKKQGYQFLFRIHSHDCSVIILICTRMPVQLLNFITNF